MVMVPTDNARRKAATNTARLVFQHGGAGYDTKLIRRDFVELDAEQFLVVANLLHGFWLELDAIQRYELKQFSGQTSTQHRTDAHAAIFGTPSKTVFTQQCRQRWASSIAE